MSKQINDAANIITTPSGSDHFLMMRSDTVKRITYSSLSALFASGGGTSFGINVKDAPFSATGDGTTDDTAAFQAAIVALIARGGGTLFVPVGTYKISALDLWDASITSGVNSRNNPPIRIIGEGMTATGQNEMIMSGTVINITTTRSNGGIYAKLNGFVEIRGITFYTKTARGATMSPMIKIMNATCHITANAFYAENDAIAIVGGGGTQTDSSGVAIGDDDGFQGYGTVIEKNFFRGQLVGIWGRCFFNGVTIRDNDVWKVSGLNQAGSMWAAGFDSWLIIDGEDLSIPNSGEKASGGLISGNLIETVGYKYGMRFMRAAQWCIVGNNFYDHTVTVACIYFGAQSSQNRVLPGWNIGSIPTVADDSTAKSNTMIYGDNITGTTAP